MILLVGCLLMGPASGPSPRYPMTTGPELKVARESAKLSLRKLAFAMHISPQYLLDLERGFRRPNAELLALHARTLARFVPATKPNVGV